MDARYVEFPAECLPRREPRHRHIWLRLRGVWRPATVTAWCRVGDRWRCLVQYDWDDGHPWSRFDWFAYHPAAIVDRDAHPEAPPEGGDGT